ncbi:kelch domain-containing protein 1-like [Denticeps clupeoides]|uniref:Kelch domain-containing protein 1-like n=1 Tax=Denticeps clupeoides TaxID=299321 RepID=A0AAY3ZXJ0_9TELE|nr:kelch domain-containing protein 1-like [Denticeps clupeoides]
MARLRSGHTAFADGKVLYVWGGCQSVNGEEVILPSDEIWLYDMESGGWSREAMKGEVPPLLSQACGSYLQGTLHVFGGCSSGGHSNQMYSVNVQDGEFSWRRVSDAAGTTPSPRDKHSCWVNRDRLIYFGGYGCKTIREVNNNQNFIVDESSWGAIGTAFFRFWGWNNEVHVYEPEENAWTEPVTQGSPPVARASHASACLGDRGYVCGGTETSSLDIHCLDLDTWTWSQIDTPAAPLPVGRSLHTLTAVTDHTLFLFGGLGVTGQPLSDVWEFDAQTCEWRERAHPHKDKPRLWHTAALGNDNDLVVFGGSCEYTVLMDSITILRSPVQKHCGDVLIFQTQPYPLLRLCEDTVGRNASLLREQVAWLPAKVREVILKRISFYKKGAPQHD